MISTLPTRLYTLELMRLQYWQMKSKTNRIKAMESHLAYHFNAQRDSAIGQALTIAAGNQAQVKRDALIDSIEDGETLDAGQQEDIWDKVQAYQRIIFEAADLLDGEQ